MTFPHAFVRWDADAIAGWEREAPGIDDDRHARVAVLSPAVDAAGATEIIPSWGADTPPWTWIEVQLRARSNGAWGRWFRVAAWDTALSDTHRTSFEAQRGDDGELATDTLVLAAPADAAQARVLLCAEPGADMPDLESLALCLTRGLTRGLAAPAPSPFTLHPSSVSLPLLLSQFSYDPRSPWCSPTSLAMALAYWRERTGDARLAPFTSAACVPEVAVPQIYDPGWGGTGNWSFNAAFAASLGLTAYVTRLHSLAQIARWTAAGVPVIVSAAWEEGEIDGAPGRTSGHLTVVRGFAGERALMAEPAVCLPDPVERSYDAAQLHRSWQRAASGTVYIVHPAGWPRPEPGEGDAWA
jgi:hypothetical protein